MKKLLFWITTINLFAFQSFGLCVVTDIANLRAGPGTKYKLTWTVGKYMPLLKVGGKGSWHEVLDLDGRRHWVFAGLVSSRIKCLAVKSLKTNLRTGPGTQFSIAAYGTADKYTPFLRLTKKDDWFNVIDASGNKVWISESNIWRPVKVSNISF